ncbi:Glycosyl hydrolases family 31 protein, partial [Aphelenchoides avenae]
MRRSVALSLLSLAALCTPSCSQQTVDPNSRLDCWPQPNPGKDVCIKRGCIWDDNQYPHHASTPLCYYPPNTGYVVKSSKKVVNGEDLTLVKAPGSIKSPYDPDVEPLTFSHRKI